MNCKDCPYIKEEYNTKISYDYQLPMIYSGYEYDIEQSCWCEKVGGKLSWYGCCGDSDNIDHKIEHHAKSRRRNKRERDTKYKKRLKFIIDNSSQYPCGAMCAYQTWTREGYVFLKTPYYKRVYRSCHSGYSKKLKAYSNRCIRRYNGEISKGGSYKKLFDYWRELC